MRDRSLFGLVLALAFLSIASSYAPGQLMLQDEGSSQGVITKLNCVGSSVSCAVSAGTGTMTVSAGGAGNFVTWTIDFGSTVPMETMLTTTVTGQAWVTSSSIILCQLTAFSTSDRAEGAEDAVLDDIKLAVANRVAGVGFDILAHAPEGATGQYIVNCTGN